jgi:hypothetical protein
MSKKVDICDVCGSRWPEYEFRHKARRWFYWPEGPSKEEYDVCDSCFNNLEKMVSNQEKSEAISNQEETK